MPSPSFINGLADSADWVPVQSTNVLEAAYFRDFKILLVRWLSGGTGCYEDVPVSVWGGFLAASSKGTFIYDEVRGAKGRRPCPKSALDHLYPYSKA